MSHLARLALLLALFGAIFLLTRSASTTLSVQFIGVTHEDNPRQWATREVQNQDAEACLECHEPTNAAWEAAPHASVSCESCHGATKEHIQKAHSHQSASLALADARDLCLTCHAELASRPSQFPQVDPSEHAALETGTRTSCALCHNPHSPGIPPAITHALDGRSDCLACHGPDEWEPVRPSHAEVTADQCTECHVPKEGES